MLNKRQFESSKMTAEIKLNESKKIILSNQEPCMTEQNA